MFATGGNKDRRRQNYGGRLDSTMRVRHTGASRVLATMAWTTDDGTTMPVLQTTYFTGEHEMGAPMCHTSKAQQIS